MDGLSGAASGIAVVSIAIQLGDSIDKLCKFVSSVRHASEELSEIADDLSLLAFVLVNIRRNEELYGPSPDVAAGLQGCKRKVDNLTNIIKSLEPGFASERHVIRKWTRVQAVRQKDKINEFRKKLEEAKATLILAQLNSANRTQHIHHETEQRSVLELSHQLSVTQIRGSNHACGCQVDSRSMFLQSNTVSTGSSSTENHSNNLYAEVDRIASAHRNPFLRQALKRSLRSAIDQVVNSSVEKMDGGSFSPETIDAPALRNARKERHVTMFRSERTVETWFGTLAFSTETFHDHRTEHGLDDQRTGFRTSFRLIPSEWMIRTGVAMGILASLERSSQNVWLNRLEPISLVPADSLIFDFCRTDNVEGVRTLLLRNEASVHDRNIGGETPLWVAAEYSAPSVCRLLIEAGSNLAVQPWGWTLSENLFGSALIHRTSEMEHETYETLDVIIKAVGDVDLDHTGTIFRGGFQTRTRAWFLESYHSLDLEHHYLDQSQLSRYLADVLLYSDNPRVWNSVQRCCKTDAIQAALYHTVLSSMFYRKARADGANREAEALKFLANAGADIHGPFRDERLYDKVPFQTPIRLDLFESSTPTFCAMTDSWIFNHWKQCLKEINHDLEAFVSVDIQSLEEQVVDHGWSTDTLLELFRDEFHFTYWNGMMHAKDWIRCNSCELMDWGLHQYTLGFGEIPWEQRKSRIKRGLSVDHPLTMEEEGDLAWFNRLAFLLGRGHFVCCEEHREVDELLSSGPPSRKKVKHDERDGQDGQDEQNSPFLLDIGSVFGD